MDGGAGKKRPASKQLTAPTQTSSPSPSPSPPPAPKKKSSTSKYRKRKIIRDNIFGITKSAIMRLAYVAGVKSLSGVTYEEVRGVIEAFMNTYIKTAVTFTEHARRKTVNKDDMLHAAERVHKKIMPTGKEGEVKRCSVIKGTKTGKYERGELALASIRHYQKQHDCFQISVKPFRRLVHEISYKYKTDLKFTSDAYGIIQTSVEKYIIELLENANLVALHSGRQTILPKDLNLVLQIVGERSKVDQK